jgi:hypothetical protein
MLEQLLNEVRELRNEMDRVKVIMHEHALLERRVLDLEQRNQESLSSCVEIESRLNETKSDLTEPLDTLDVHSVSAESL